MMHRMLRGNDSLRGWQLICLAGLAVLVAACGTTLGSRAGSNDSASGPAAVAPTETEIRLVATCAGEQAQMTPSGNRNVVTSGVAYLPSKAAIAAQLTPLAPYTDPAFVAVLRGSFSDLDTSGRPHDQMWVLIPRSALVNPPQMGEGACVLDDVQGGGWQQPPDLTQFGEGVNLPTSALTGPPTS